MTKPPCRLAKVVAILCAVSCSAWGQQDAPPPAAPLEPDYATVAADVRKIADEIDARQIGQHMEDGRTKLNETEGATGHLKVDEAYVDLGEMISFCESTGGNAKKACRFKLKLSMGMSPGGTFGQMSRGSKPGTGQFGNFGQGSSGQSGGGTPYAIFGPESLGGRLRASSRIGNVKRKSDSLDAGDRDPLAGNVDVLNSAKNNELQYGADSSGRVMEEYRSIIEEYFRRLAEEGN